MKIKTCVLCNNSFAQHQVINGKKYNFKNRKRCLKCSPIIFRNKSSIETYICTNCQKPFERKRNKPKGNVFCNRACAVTYNNKQQPKRIKKTKKCSTCENIIGYKNTYCSTCWQRNRAVQNNTLNYYKEKRKDSNRYSPIRDNARRVVKNRPQKCIICGYDKHVEVAHKKEIWTYSPDTLVSEINHPDNLIILCKNHHWELDHNLLDKN